VTSLQQLIQRNLNPFDASTFKPGNFWQENQDPNQEVEGIHWSVLQTIERTLDQVASDRRTRTLLLTGDSGSGKSYLLGRLKRQLNSKAFFAYIGPWPDSDYLWRHTLRSTIDSLIHAPEGQSESQLVLWLKGLPSLRDRNFAKWILGERGIFIRDLRASFPAGIYNAKEFFGVLYDLVTNPELRPLAYDWLKGDDLDQEDLKALRVKRSLDSEDAAHRVLGNFGRLAVATQPIVLCFDNLDGIPRLGNDKLDLQSLFNLNSTIHNESLNNVLVIISIITGTWRQNRSAIQPADQARIHKTVNLHPINLEQAQALWASRLASIHAQAKPKPDSAIAPLSADYLNHKFPGGKTLPRNTLMLGQRLITHFKQHGTLPDLTTPPPEKPGQPSVDPPIQANFNVTWEKEFKTVQQQVTRISQFTSPELIWRLRQVLEALQVPQITPQFLTGSRFASYSLSHQHHVLTGIVWSEDRNMNTFFHLMNACQKQVAKNACDRLYFIRAENLGNPRNRGQKIYQQVFQSQTAHRHIQPDLLSVQYLETYHKLATAAQGGELVIGQTTPHLKDLQAFVRESKVLEPCPLLQELQVVATPAGRKSGGGKAGTTGKTTVETSAIADYILNIVATQSLIGRVVLVQNAQQQFPKAEADQLDTAVKTLCQQNRIQLLDPNADPAGQLICYVPQ
jgi:hypothetical protein